MPSALKPILSDSPSAATPRISGRRSTRWRFTHDTSGSETTSISPSAASVGSSSRPPASCSGDGLRTATAHVETPRIITPSRTAWPPIGASRGTGAPFCGSASLIPSLYRREPREPTAFSAQWRAGRAQDVVVLVGLVDLVAPVDDHPHRLLARRCGEAHGLRVPGVHPVEAVGVRRGAVHEEVHSHA